MSWATTLAYSAVRILKFTTPLEETHLVTRTLQSSACSYDSYRYIMARQIYAISNTEFVTVFLVFIFINFRGNS